MSEIRVNPIECRAHGLCAELVPEMIGLDEWGYPLIRRGPVPASLQREVKQAISACPTLALRLERG